ncbi:MAG: TIGR02452 family protein [Clostridia bacterium]|nr:TIGR02452 family protein [Clostridia bacterium]
MKIVVLTGSFNPITKAHYSIMDSALKYINGDLGLFVATDVNYLRKKYIVKKHSTTEKLFILDNETRKEMISSIPDKKMKFWGFELGGASPSTEKTLRKIIKEYPGCELYYLCGADKLKSIPNWKNVDELFNNVKLIVSCRSDIDIDKVIDKSVFLTDHKERIMKLQNDEDNLDVSATKIRELYFNGENYKNLMIEEPYNILNKIDPNSFKYITDEDVIAATIKFGGRFKYSDARKLVFKTNAEMFNKWDDDLLGNRSDLINNTKIYKDCFVVESSNNYDTVFDCINKDCVDVANELQNDGFNPAILNLASRTSPCGGYHMGAHAQEETLAQSSTLSQSLYQFGNPKYKHIRAAYESYAEKTNVIKPDGYPLDINYGGIYSPGVTVFRNNIDKNYSLREEPFKVSIITVASLAYREENFSTKNELCYFTVDGSLNNEGLEIEKNKIRTIFRIGLFNNHDSLVLGAFGCGAYHLKPDEVSQLFYDVLNENEFKGKFKKIVFSILEKSTKKNPIVGKDGKFKPFYDKFSK